jgi:hypothetical protein
MGQTLEALRQLTPIDPRPYVYGLVQRLLAGQREEARQGLESFLQRFGSTAQYLELLAVPLAEIAERELLEQVIAFAQQQGFELSSLKVSLVQSLVARGDWRDAAAVLVDFAAGAKKDPAAVAWMELMNAQIQAALDPSEGTQSTLVSLIRGRQFPLSSYKKMIGNLQRAGRIVTARELITYAQGMYPQNVVLESLRRELDTQLANLAASKDRETTLATEARRKELNQALATAVLRKADTPQVKPHTASARPTATALSPRTEWSEADYFLEALTQNGDNAGALKSIRDLRRTKPAWLGAREGELCLAEVRLNGREGDVLALRSVVRRYLTGDRLRGAQMIESASELHASGHNSAALLVLRELIAKMPDYLLAQSLLAEWSVTAPAQLMSPTFKVE